MCKILIVEDEISVRQIVEDFITKIGGMTYKSASSAVEALLNIEKYQTIRLCLLDLHLPGMDGLTLCRKIKAIDPMMICIAMTGFKTLFSLVECRLAGFDDVVFKPFDFDLLKALLLEYDAKLKRWQNHKS